MSYASKWEQQERERERMIIGGGGDESIFPLQEAHELP
jgi:hypothetical protein